MGFIETEFNRCIVFLGVLDLKNGALIRLLCFSIQDGKTKKEKVDCPVKCFPDESGLVFSKELVINSGRYLDIGCEENRSAVSINFLNQKYTHKDMLTRG